MRWYIQCRIIMIMHLDRINGRSAKSLIDFVALSCGSERLDCMRNDLHTYLVQMAAMPLQERHSCPFPPLLSLLTRKDFGALLAIGSQVLVLQMESLEASIIPLITLILY